MKMPKSNVFWAKPVEWYWYQRVVLVPKSGTGTHDQRASGTGTTQTGTGTHWQRGTGTGTTSSSSPVCAYFCTVNSRITIPIVRDPKK